jgi:hypothetical protein
LAGYGDVSALPAVVGWETNELRIEMTRLNDRLGRAGETLARMEVARESAPR